MGVQQPRGVKDFGPSEAIAIGDVTRVIEEIFRRFGFYPIITPVIETMDTLTAKGYGEEAAKEIYKIEGEDSGMRFDFTVPMSRYLAMNRSIPMPFKRYQIGQIWRKDEPQRMRYREFLQADVDIIGSSEPISDAEVIAAPALALDELGIEYKILINSRVFLNNILSLFGVPEESHTKAIRIIDKLNKIGVSGVEEQFATIKIEKKVTDEIIAFVTKEGSNTEKLEELSAKISGVSAEVKNMLNIINLLESYKIRGEIVVDFSLARGLDYYTSGVWEFVLYEGNQRLPTIAAGGRYDNLIGLYSKNDMPATGTSLGINRIFDVLGFSETRKTYATVYVASIGDTLDYALYVANALRAQGIYTDLNVTKRNISKQLDYANVMKFKYVLIVGEEEKSKSKVKLKNMLSGNEEIIDINSAIEIIKHD